LASVVDRSSFYLAAMLIIIVTGLTLPSADTGGWEETGAGRTDAASEGEPAAYPVSMAAEEADPGQEEEPDSDDSGRGGDTGDPGVVTDPDDPGVEADPGEPYEEHGPPFIPASGTRAGNDTPEPTDERSLEYLIITPQMWKKTLNKLAKWKTQKGVVARVDTVEQCEAAYPDEPDLAASIQAYLRGAKADNKNLTWVLLAGDSEYIPERFVYTRHANKSAYIELDNYAASDLYYAGLDHEWDLDKDTI
jgi:hypothetical protein